MTIHEFAATHNMHDSLLEAVICEDATVTLVIDYCCWQQSGYREGMPETGMVHVIFEHVTAIRYTPYAVSSDTIIRCEALDENTILFEVMSDQTAASHVIQISAASVSVISISE